MIRFAPLATPLLLTMVACTGAPPPAVPPEHARAYAVCQGIMRDGYEHWRRTHRKEMSAAEFSRRIRFAERGSDRVRIRNLGGGVYEVSAEAERPGETRQRSIINGKFTCALKESWTQVGHIISIG